MSICSNSQPIVLVCAADNNYAMPLAVTVRSALENLGTNQKIVLFILDGGITESNKNKIIKSLQSEQINISWVKPDNARFTNLVLTRHLTPSCYYRLLITEFLPPEFKKAIYLDTDMVVTGDLGEIWNIEIGDDYALAVQDDVDMYISMCDGLRNYKEVGLSGDAKYFNSGLLVINLEKWRTDNIGAKVLEYIQQYKEYVRNDQDGLNAVLAGKWRELHPKWNQMPRIYDYPSWENSPFPKDVYQDAFEQPCIIHFTNTPKPWYAGVKKECTHPKKDLFFQYLDFTDWSGWRDTMWRRIARKFMKLTSLNTSKL